MRIKKMLFAALALAVLFGAAGCGGKNAPNKVYSADDMAGMNIGVVAGSAATVYAEGYGTLHAYESAETMLVDLKNNILDCAVMDQYAAKATLRKVRGLKILGEPLVQANFCLAVAKENPDLTKDVNSALGTLEDAGILEDILEGCTGKSDYTYVSPPDIDRSAGTLTVAFDGNFPPYSYDDGSGTLVGLDVDIARAVCDLLHVDMEISLVPRQELVTTVQYGKADLSLSGVTNNEANALLVDFSDPYTTCTQVIVVRK
jgi:polar amino acid transport system substrate-binding protein